MLYKEMTAEQRLDAYGDNREAATLHETQFCLRPYNPRRRLDRQAWTHMERCAREAAFIERIARSCGDAWAQK